MIRVVGKQHGWMERISRRVFLSLYAHTFGDTSIRSDDSLQCLHEPFDFILVVRFSGLSSFDGFPFFCFLLSPHHRSHLLSYPR